MALVLPILRLWLLLLNIYGTFKAMKPPTQSQRNARNKSGPSSRAMQLRKRELKSCLAVWVVWSIFSTIESLMDRTMGIVTPFYNEFKCLVLLFLLISRAHGAEAIFLHLVHPLLRPYVPAVDDILANLHSVFDLFLLLFFLPFEYISNLWHRWRWATSTGEVRDEHPGDDEAGGGEALPDERRVLRPRNEAQQARLREADRQAQVVFQDIDDAQDRVRVRARNQLLAPTTRGGQLNRGARGIDSDPTAVGLRTRKRVLEYPPQEGQARGPGSRTTGVHLVYRTTLEELPPPPSLQPFPVLPNAPASQPMALPSNPLPLPPQPSTQYEIWHPPRSASENNRRRSPADAPPRTPSPLYPPLPSAYIFTPRVSDPPPPPPRIITPPNLVTPTPRRVSTGTAASRGTFDASGRRLPGRTNQSRPLRTARSAEPPGHHRQDHQQTEDFFGRALEPSIQAEEMDMETETLSTRDGSSANDEDMGTGGANLMSGEGSTTRRSLRSRHKVDSGVKKGKRKASTLAEPLRRSARNRTDRSSSIETDEFGFTIRPSSTTLSSIATASTSASDVASVGPSRKKPLARTKPASNQEEDGIESSDEESEKKRQRLNPVVESIPENLSSELQDAERDGWISDGDQLYPLGRRNLRGDQGKRNDHVQKAQGPLAPKKPKQTVSQSNRATRASTRRPVSARDDQLRPVGGTKKARGR